MGSTPPIYLAVSLPGVGGDDRLGEQARRVEVADLFRQPSFSSSEGIDRVGNCYFLKYRIVKNSRRLAHKETVRRRRKNSRRAGLAATAGSAQQSAAGADQIIKNHDCAIAHLTNQ